MTTIRPLLVRPARFLGSLGSFGALSALAVTTAVTAIAAVGCGGGAVAPGTTSATTVQTTAMKQTFAGQNACNPKNHSRPFIIEWDATDMSSFEARAANDVIFVRYEGCDLQVLDSCVDDSVKGSLGSYKPVEWTSGSLESLDVANQGDLYAKLPLGAATLGGRVEGGEKFHMEYFVSGTRSATRDTIYRGDIEKRSGCKSATHFVYAYNLGAFALGAQSEIKGSVGGSVFGFGAGGSRSQQSKADKQGGLLSSCRGESAKEVATCKVPIRLTLREISDGESADTKDSAAPETPSAANLAGRLKASTDRERKASEHYQSAVAKLNARDGKGCLSELDHHDKLDPRPSGLSTSTEGFGGAGIRAQCLMLAGQCPAGKALMRKVDEKQLASYGPEMIDKAVESIAADKCQGGSMTPRDQLLQAARELQLGMSFKKDKNVCINAFQTVKRLLPTVQPKDDDDTQVKNAPDFLGNWAVACLARAGDCDTAWEIYRTDTGSRFHKNLSALPPEAAAVQMRVQFKSAALQKCN